MDNRATLSKTCLHEDVFLLAKCVLLSRFEVNETIGLLTLVAYRNKGTYGNVSLLLFAQSLEAQQGLDYNASETVRRRFVHAFKHNKNTF